MSATGSGTGSRKKREQHLLYVERRNLRNEEKTLREMIRRTRVQIAQLDVEQLELRARIRQQEMHSSSGGSADRSDPLAAEGHKNPAEDLQEQVDLDLTPKNHQQILDQLMGGQFISGDVEEEEDDDESEDLAVEKERYDS